MKPIIPSLNNISPSSSTSLAFNSYSREASLHLHFILFSFSFDSRVTSQSYNILFPSLFLYNKFFNLFFKISIQCWKQILIPKRFSASVSFSLVSIPSAKPRFFHSLPALNHCYWLKEDVIDWFLFFELWCRLNQSLSMAAALMLFSIVRTALTSLSIRLFTWVINYFSHFNDQLKKL